MLLPDIVNGVVAGKPLVVEAAVHAALSSGTPAKAVLDEGLLAGMNVVGERFKAGEIFVPTVMLAARAMKKGMEILKPLLSAAGVEPLGTVVIGTIKGDLHDIGKNLVGMMLEGAGFRVIDAGIDVAPERFWSLATEHGAQIIGVSALLTTTMVKLREVVAGRAVSGFPVKVMVGGAPVSQRFADEIGADGYSADAASAAELAKRLMGVA